MIHIFIEHKSCSQLNNNYLFNKFKCHSFNYFIFIRYKLKKKKLNFISTSIKIFHDGY